MTNPAFPRKLVTTASLCRDLQAIGIKAGDNLLVHCAFSKLGSPYGGVQALIDALQRTLTEAGTLVMPTHTTHLTEPSRWENPPAPEAWWPDIRAGLPAYDAERTPTRAMGMLAETFRRYPQVVRSNHPHGSFAAWGKEAQSVTAQHKYPGIFGEDSPLARLYERNAKVLLIGVGHGNNTSLHLAEYRADFAKVWHTEGAPIIEAGQRRWAEAEELKIDSDDFPSIGADFAKQTGLEQRGKLGQADTLCMPQRALVDFGVQWMSQHRNQA